MANLLKFYDDAQDTMYKVLVLKICPGLGSFYPEPGSSPGMFSSFTSWPLGDLNNQPI